MLLLFTACLAVICPPQSIAAQTSAPSVGSQAPAAPPTFKAYSRMVYLDVVVEDKAGHHVTGLKASDFRIFEQTLSKGNQRREQRIATIREIHTAALKPPAALPANPQPGVYTNAVAVAAQQDPVPPTVLVVDGVNTELQYQAQVHVQMLKILRQLPPNVPVAVLLMGTHLTLLQGFTTDPRLLQQALAKAYSVVGEGEHLDPRDDPDNPANLLSGLMGGSANKSMEQIIQGFLSEPYVPPASMRRILMTLDDFISIAQSLEGYPGRKNLLWLSTSFPWQSFVPWAPRNMLHPGFDDNQEIPRHMQILNSALSNAKVAVYPVNVAGVTTLKAYSAAARPATAYAGEDTAYDSLRVAAAVSRQSERENSELIIMEDLAEGTGGKVCTGDNDLGDCIRKAVADSSDFYEISYYPDSPDWNGEYRTVFVEPKARGARLSYRRGYYATPEGNPDPKSQAAELQDHCDDLLNATAIAFTAKSLPPDSPDQLKFSLLVDASALSLPQAADGSYQLNLGIGVCTYNKKQSPLQLMTFPLNIKLTQPQFDQVMSTGKLTDTILVPGPHPAGVRLLVKDVRTGKLGSIYIKTGDLEPALKIRSPVPPS